MSTRNKFKHVLEQFFILSLLLLFATELKAATVINYTGGDCTQPYNDGAGWVYVISGERTVSLVSNVTIAAGARLEIQSDVAAPASERNILNTNGYKIEIYGTLVNSCILNLDCPIVADSTAVYVRDTGTLTNATYGKIKIGVSRPGGTSQARLLIVGNVYLNNTYNDTGYGIYNGVNYESLIDFSSSGAKTGYLEIGQNGGQRNYIFNGAGNYGYINLGFGSLVIKSGIANTIYNGYQLSEGTINISSGGLLDIQSGASIKNAHVSNGTVNVRGELRIGGEFRNGSELSNASIASVSVFDSGTVNIQGNGYFWNGYITRGFYAQYNNGTTNVTGLGSFYNGFGPANGVLDILSGTFNVNGAGAALLNGYGSTGTITVYDGGTLTQTQGYVSNGKGSGKTGNIYINGNYNVDGGNLYNGDANTGQVSTGYIEVYVSGKLTVNNGALINGARGSGGTASIVVKNTGKLTLNSNAYMINGYERNGTITVEGGTLLSTTTFENGSYGAGTGTLTVAGGNVHLYRSTCEVGNTASGIININSGTLAYTAATIDLNRGSFNVAVPNHSIDNQTILNNSTNGVINIPSGKILNIGSITSSGTINLNGGTTSLSGVINVIRGALNLNTSNLTIPSGSSLSNLENGTLLINTGRILTNNGTLLICGPFVNLGTLVNNGSSINTYSNPISSLPASTSITIPNGASFSIPKSNTFLLNGTLNNLSSNSIDVYGNLFVNNTLNNGGATAGTLNVNAAGKIFVVGGNIINGHPSSAINVYRGGTISNYYGTINTTNGSLTFASGGNFYNTRGNYPTNITFNSGSSCIENDEVYLTENLSLDFTLTITNKTVINGKGHVITFNSNNGIIKVAKNASLMLHDIIMQNVSANQIRCLATNSTLSVDKCTWLLDGNYSFTKGQIYVAGDWNIIGNNHSFSYQSRKESSIDPNANLNLVDTTFIYDIAISSTLFNPLSADSNICLKNSTLQASQVWKPSSGTILTSGNVTLNGVATLDLQNIDDIKPHGSIRRLGNVLM